MRIKNLEPFDLEGATFKKPGGGYVCGLGGSSSNASLSTTTSDSFNEKKGVEGLGEGAIGLSVGEGASVNFSPTDGGAFDLVAANDVQMGKNYDSLLTTTSEGFDNLVSASGKSYDKLLNTTSDLFGQSADQYSGLLSATTKGFDNLLSASTDIADTGSANYKSLLSSTQDLFGQVFDLSGSNYDKLLSSADKQSGQTADLFGQVFDLSGSNYEKLLSNTSTTMAGLMDSIGATQNWIQGSLDTAQSKGTLDNRTITVIGVALAAVIGIFLLRGKRA